MHWFGFAWLLNTLLKTYGFAGCAWLEVVRGERGGPLRFVYENVYVCEGWKYGVNASLDTWIR